MTASIVGSQATNVGGTGNVIQGSGSPVGSVSATGPSVYLDNTTPSAPVLYVKSTTGTSSSDWVLVGTFSNS